MSTYKDADEPIEIDLHLDELIEKGRDGTVKNIDFITSNLHCTHGIMRDVGGSFWEMHTNQLKITLFLYKNGFCVWRKPHLGVDVVSFLRPFCALR